MVIGPPLSHGIEDTQIYLIRLKHHIEGGIPIQREYYGIDKPEIPTVMKLAVTCSQQ